MATRLQGDFYSERENTKYTVTIDDSSYVGSVIDFNLTSLRLKYSGETNELTNPILTSSLEMGIRVENSDINSFLTDLIGASEERFRVKVDKDDSLFWVGHILLDISGVEDAPVHSNSAPILNLTATDGLGRLKDLDYNDAGSDYTGKERFTEHIFNILDKLNLDDFWGTDDEYLYTVNLWYETQQTYSVFDDPFYNARFDHKALISVDSKGTKKYKTCFEVLEEICRNWKARFMLSGGRYRLVQVNEHRKTTFNAIHRYKKAGTAFSTDLTGTGYVKTLDTDINKIKGGTRLWFPPLDKVEITYKHFSTINHIPGEGFSQSFASGDLATETFPTITLTDIDSNSNEARFLVTFNISYSADFTTGDPNLLYKFKFRVKVGTYYLKRTASISSNGTITTSAVSWTTSSSDYYEFFSNVMIADNYTYITAVEFITPPLEEDGSGEVKLIMTDILNPDGTTNTDNFTVNFAFLDPYMEVLEDGNIEDRSNYTVFTSTNNNSNNIAKYEKEVSLGDGPGPNTFGHIEVWDGSFWRISGAWKRQNTGTYVAFTQLLADEIMAARYAAVERNLGTFTGDMAAHSTISKGGIIFMLGAGTLDLRQDEFDGEWWQMGVDTSQTTAEASQDYIENPNVRFQQTPPGASEDPPQDNPNVEIGLVSGSDAPSLTTDQAIADGTTSFVSIPVNNVVYDDVYLEGDDIFLINPNTGVQQQFEVSSDVSAGDTAISVVSSTVVGDYPVGSYVTQEPEQRSRQNSLGRMKFLHFDLTGYATDIPAAHSGGVHTYEVFFRIKDTDVGIDSKLEGARIYRVWWEIGQAVSGSPLVGYTAELFRGASTTVSSQSFNGQSTIVGNGPSSGEENLVTDVYRFKVTRSDLNLGSPSKGLACTIELFME